MLAFDVMDDARLPSGRSTGFCEGNEALGNHTQIFHAESARRLASAISATRSPSRR